MSTLIGTPGGLPIFAYINNNVPCIGSLELGVKPIVTVQVNQDSSELI
jgi:hypothetical protein